MAAASTPAREGVPIHPSRTAPLCVHCYHSHTPASGGALLCAHWAAPVSPVDGSAVLPCSAMRGGDEPGTWRTTAFCGPEGRLFHLRRLSPEAMQQRVRGLAPLASVSPATKGTP